jgi:hypothetical protein
MTKGVKTKKIKTGLDRNFAMDKKIRKLQVEVKKNPAFKKFVKLEIKRELDKVLPIKLKEKKDEIDVKAKRIGELSIENDSLRTDILGLRRASDYIDKHLANWATITTNGFKITRVVAFLVGFMWISWLLITNLK